MDLLSQVERGTNGVCRATVSFLTANKAMRAFAFIYLYFFLHELVTKTENKTQGRRCSYTVLTGVQTL